MKTHKLRLVFFFTVIIGIISCEKEKDKIWTGTPENVDNTDLYDFYLYDVNSNVTTKITSSSNEIEYAHSISPDSKKILYANEHGINEMNIDGSGNRILVTKGSDPCYSPDGGRIAFINEDKLYAINTDGTSKTQICNKNIRLYHPVWSKDGENIVCSSDSGLCIVSLNGSLHVFSSRNSANWYDWSNDSKEIYYSKYDSKNFTQIFKYNLLLDKEFKITNIDNFNYTPKCHPDENIILFTSSNANNGKDLIMCDQDGLNQKVLIHKNVISHPFWSPEGDKIVFETEGQNLAIIDKNGGNYKIINEKPGACMDPIWSNDGKYILYYRAIYYQ